MYPYTQNTGNLISVIKDIGKHGKPDKFTTKELPIWGYKSSNDRSIISVFKFIGLIDSTGTPTDRWMLARTNPESATGEGVQDGYSEIFKTFSEAQDATADQLTNFFKAKTEVGEAGIKAMVSTFRALAEYGEFVGVKKHSNNDESKDESETAAQTKIEVPIDSSSPGMTVNLNVELVVPTDATGDVYDKFFAAMRKHLMGS
ncbi:MAG: DUF5343 domain-containing protein [Alteraurantiacibacter sp.]